MTPYALAGCIGVAYAFVSYLATLFGKIKPNGLLYPAGSVFIGCMIGISLIDKWNLPSALIQLMFSSISLLTLAYRIWRKAV